MRLFERKASHDKKKKKKIIVDGCDVPHNVPIIRHGPDNALLWFDETYHKIFEQSTTEIYQCFLQKLAALFFRKFQQFEYSMIWKLSVIFIRRCIVSDSNRRANVR